MGTHVPLKKNNNNKNKNKRVHIENIHVLELIFSAKIQYAPYTFTYVARNVISHRVNRISYHI